MQKQYDDVVDVRVFVSKAGEQVIKYYKLFNTLEKHFDKVWVEINANSPFLAGQLQLKRYEFLLLAPATSNTVAKIAIGPGRLAALQCSHHVPEGIRSLIHHALRL